MVLFINAPKNFDARKHIEAPVEPPPVRDGIDMAADEQGALRFAAKSRPEIAGGVGVNLDWEFLEFFLQPFASRDPGFGEGDALSPVFIGRQTAEFFQF